MTGIRKSNAISHIINLSHQLNIKIDSKELYSLSGTQLKKKAAELELQL